MDKATLVIVMASLFAKNGMAQEREEPILYGNMAATKKSFTRLDPTAH